MSQTQPSNATTGVLKVGGNWLSKSEAVEEVRNGNQRVIKEITMGDFQDGGQLNRQQFAEFYREVFRETPAMGEVRTVPLDGPQSEIDKIGLDRFILMPVGESENVSETAINSGEVELDVKEAGFGYELSQRTVEDTIERQNTAEIILDMHSDRFGTDLEHLAMRGDESYTNDNAPQYATFRSQNDGWFVKAEADGATVTDAGGSPVTSDTFFSLEYGIPDRYMEATSPVFWVHPKQATALRQYLSGRDTDLGDQTLEGPYSPTPTGRRMIETGAVPPTKIMMTDPNNLIYAPHREMTVDVTTEGKDVVFKRLFGIYAMTARFDFAVEEGEGVSIIENLSVPEGAATEEPPAPSSSA